MRSPASCTWQRLWVGAARGAAALAILGLGCAGFNRLPQERGLHPRLTPTTYLEEGRLAAFAVDTAAAEWREDGALVPLPVSVLNKSLDRLTLTRESFTLVDDQGRRHPLATVEESRGVGALGAMDWRLSDQFFQVVSNSYAAWTYQHAVFFPNVLSEPQYARRGLLRDRLELPLRAWAADLLYFLRPSGALRGRTFELWLTAPELAEPLFVKFRIGR